MKVKNTLIQERNSKIIEFYISWYKLKEIIPIMNQLWYNITFDIVQNVVWNHNEKVSQLNYSDRKIVSTEKSLIRSREESNFQRKINREILKEDIKKEDIYELVKESISKEVKPIKVTPYKVKESWSKVFQLTDIHIWKKWTTILQEGEILTIQDRLNILANDILTCKENNIVLAITGDLNELMSQVEKHSWMRLTLELQTYVQNQEFTKNWLIWLLEEVRKRKKKITIILLRWNHDVVTKNKDDDLLWIPVYELSEYLKAYYRNETNIKIIFDPYSNRVVYRELKEVDLSCSHWENWENWVKAKDLRVKYKEMKEKYMIFLTWHRHEGKIEYYFNTAKVIWIWFAWGWDYDDKKWLYWNNGYTVIEFFNWFPQISFRITD